MFAMIILRDKIMHDGSEVFCIIPHKTREALNLVVGP